LAGRGRGVPTQQFQMTSWPLEDDSLQLSSQTPGGLWNVWERREDFDASNNAQYHYLADRTSGTLRAGNGAHGRVAGDGDLFLASAFSTAAQDGNVAAGAITHLSKGPVNEMLLAAVSVADQAQLQHAATNPFRASGGSAEQNLASLASEAVRVLHAHEQL